MYNLREKGVQFNRKVCSISAEWVFSQKRNGCLLLAEYAYATTPAAPSDTALNPCNEIIGVFLKTAAIILTAGRPGKRCPDDGARAPRFFRYPYADRLAAYFKSRFRRSDG